jgi:FMN phosphatase YigB (HAD superfamily)
MQVSKRTLERLSWLRSRYIVILLTGNMDSFSRFTVPTLGLEKYFDYISNSYHEGRLKTDNNGEIFRMFTDRFGVALRECILIDDSLGACRMFEALGGVAYLVTAEKNIDYYLALL